MNAVARALRAEPVTAIPASQATQIEQQRAIAEVQAMVVVAQRAPRDLTRCIQRMKETCGQMGLAEGAFFKFPRGGQTVSGPSIHLAVELARCWGNITYGIQETDRDDAKKRSEMIAFAWDLETNTRATTSFIVPHLRDKRGGGEVLTDMRDIYENNANMGARRLREMIFRVLPRWFTDDAEETCMATLRDGGGEPLPKRIAKALERFEAIGISRERIETKVGASADKMTATDLARIGVSFKSIERGEVMAEDEFPSVKAAAVSAALTTKPAPDAVSPAAKDAANGAAGADNASAGPERKPVPHIAVPAADASIKVWQNYRGQLIEMIKTAPDAAWLAEFQERNQDGLTVLDTDFPPAAKMVREAIQAALAGFGAEG